MGVNLKFFKWSISLLIFSFYLKYDNSGFLSVAGVFLKEYKFKNSHTKSKKNKYKCVLKSNQLHWNAKPNRIEWECNIDWYEL